MSIVNLEWKVEGDEDFPDCYFDFVIEIDPVSGESSRIKKISYNNQVIFRYGNRLNYGDKLTDAVEKMRKIADHDNLVVKDLIDLVKYEESLLGR